MIDALAHGGVGGAIVEVALVLTVLAVFFAVWRRERVAASESKATDEEAP